MVAGAAPAATPWLTVVCDGAWRDGRGGWAWIATDHLGVEVERAAGRCRPGVRTSHRAEREAFDRALDWGARRGVHLVVLTDAVDVVEHARRRYVTRRKLFPRVTVRHVDRARVAEAHALARAARS